MILKKIDVTDSSVSNDEQSPTISLTLNLEFSVDNIAERTNNELDATTLKDKVVQRVMEQLQQLSDIT